MTIRLCLPRATRALSQSQIHLLIILLILTVINLKIHHSILIGVSRYMPCRVTRDTAGGEGGRETPVECGEVQNGIALHIICVLEDRWIAANDLLDLFLLAQFHFRQQVLDLRRRHASAERGTFCRLAIPEHLLAGCKHVSRAKMPTSGSIISENWRARAPGVGGASAASPGVSVSTESRAFAALVLIAKRCRSNSSSVISPFLSLCLSSRGALGVDDPQSSAI